MSRSRRWSRLLALEEIYLIFNTFPMRVGKIWSPSVSRREKCTPFYFCQPVHSPRAILCHLGPLVLQDSIALFPVEVFSWPQKPFGLQAVRKKKKRKRVWFAPSGSRSGHPMYWTTTSHHPQFPRPPGIRPWSQECWDISDKQGQLYNLPPSN